MTNNGNPNQCQRRDAYDQIERALDMIIDSLTVLSKTRIAEAESVDEDGNITLLFQDVARLKDHRQPVAPADAPAHTEGLPSPAEYRTPFRTQHSPEWKIQRSCTARGSIFEFRISLSRGAIEAPTGHEFRT